MRKVQSTAWGGGPTAGSGTGGSGVEATISAVAIASDCELGGCTDALASFATAGVVPRGGRPDIWQQEPSPEGASEILVSE